MLVRSGYEQVWPTYAFSKSAQLALLHAVPDPPPECASFYALSEEPDGRVVQVDAMIVAQAKDIPTLNGYSGRSPDGWLLNWPPDRAPYRREVEAWKREHGLSRVCALDFATKMWSVVDPP